MKAYDTVAATAVANAFISRGASDNQRFSALQLLKLTYIAHGWSLAFFDKPLLDDDVVAWSHGPIIPNLYRAIDRHCGKYIEPPIQLLKGEKGVLSDNHIKLVEFVYRRYGHLDGVSLSSLTNQPDSPWWTFYNKTTCGRKIPDAVIAKHYKRELEKVKLQSQLTPA